MSSKTALRAVLAAHTPYYIWIEIYILKSDIFNEGRIPLVFASSHLAASLQEDFLKSFIRIKGRYYDTYQQRRKRTD